MTNRSLIIGGGIPGVRAALDLAEAGQSVCLIEAGPILGADVSGGDGRAASDLSRQDVVPMLLRAVMHPGIDVMTSARLIDLKGEPGRFRARIARTPTYVSEEICRGCGLCVEACPVTLDPGRAGGDRPRKAIDFPAPGAVPFVPTIVKERRAPCVETCPAHINIQGYIALVSKGKFREAYDLIRETIPFPSVCGRVCFHPCETACNRDEVDEPIAINNIKRFVSEYVHNEGLQEPPEPLNPTGPRVAIVGSGPAGLTAAHDLIRMGYRPTVFESLDEPGGMLRVGIVSYRLPKEILAREIADLEAYGVEIVTGCRIGEDLSLEDLDGRGFESIFLSTGAHGARRLGIEGESLKGVVDGVDFLREVNLKGKYRLGKETIVIGGGNVALDCARTALRVGAERVRVVCLESRAEMPSHEWEIEEALEEGIVLMPSLGPHRIVGARGRVTGLETLDVKHVFDETGRFNPAFHEGTESIVEGTSIITAIGQVAEKSYLDGVEGIERDGRGLPKIDPRTLMTTRPGLFAGGDLVTGPASVIDAIAQGKQAAVAIDAYLRGDESGLREWDPARGGRTEPYDVPAGVRKASRVRPGRLDPAARTRDFAEVERTITAEMAIAEASRCLNCGACSECMECVRVCDVLHALDHAQFVEEVEIEAAGVIVASDLNGGNGDGAPALAERLGIERDRKGRAALPRFSEGSLATSREGIYAPATGSDRGDDWFEKMLRASAASGELAETWGRPLPEGVVRERPAPEGGRATKVAAFVCRCGGAISDTVDVAGVAERLGGVEGVAHTGVVDYACSPEGLATLRAHVEGLGLDALLLAACSCCSLEQVCGNCSHQRLRQKEGLLAELGLERERLELVNVREHAAWAHADDPAAATRVAIRMTMAGMQGLVARAPRDGERTRAVGQRVAVVGDGTIARSCAISLQGLGFDTVLLWTGASGARDGRLPASHVIENVGGVELRGGVGAFSLRPTGAGRVEEVRSDFVVLAGDDAPVLEDARTPKRFSVLEPFSDRKRGLFRVHGTKKSEKAWKTMAGRALAMRVLVERGSGVMPVTSWAPEVDAFWCRGCGTCEEVCPFDAVHLVERDRSVRVSKVDPLVCEGCEICVLHCPTGALRAGYFDDRNLDRLLGALLGEENGGGAPKVVVYACHWCHYGGPAFGERRTLVFPPGVRVLRMTCTGRIGPGFILKAFRHGADGVMVMGCPDGECHSIDGNRSYREHEGVVLDLMEAVGIDRERYRTLWTTPDEGARFMREMEAFVKGLGGGDRR